MNRFNQRVIELQGPDFYPTPAWGTAALLRHVKFAGTILEPCCGDGAMAEVLEKYGYGVHAFDLHDRGYGKVQDFLKFNRTVDNIVTNPPFNIAELVLSRALQLASYKVCLLLRLPFLESAKRYALFKRRPPEKVLVFSERLSIYPKGKSMKNGGTTPYAWFVWNRHYKGPTTIEWIEPRPKSKKSPN